MIIRLSDYEMNQAEASCGMHEGGTYAVAEVKNLMSGAISYLFKDQSSGWGGNMDANCKRYHGWRGTTNDRSRTALGVFTIKSIQLQKNGLYRVDIGKDIHPDWD